MAFSLLEESGSGKKKKKTRSFTEWNDLTAVFPEALRSLKMCMNQ